VDTRRVFLAALLLAATGGLVGSRAAGQDPTIPQDRREGPGVPHEAPMNPEAQKKILDDNEKDIKKKIERLYALATELKAEVDKTDSSKVLNLTVVKKAEEIEKLAHDIKSRSKG
jgi:hypothetical protein